MVDERSPEEPSEAELHKAARLLAVFERKRDDGSYYFSEQDVQHFLPLVFLTVSGGAPSAELPDAVVQLLGLFASQAGVDAEDGPEAVQRAVERFYESNPVHPELLAAFQGFVREELAGSGDAAVAKAFASFLGSEETTDKSVLGGGERPAGTTPGSMARFAGVDDDEG